MVSWQRKKLGEILTQRKEQVLIQRDVEYSLVTISNKGTVRLREKKKGALISAKKGYIAKSGDFIYSRLSVHTGAFGIVPSELDQALITGEMPCFAIDKKQVHPNILIDLIGLPDFLWQLKQLAKGMGRVRIKESMMMDLSVTLPSVTEQKKFAENLKIKKYLRNSMENEIIHQQILLKKLRQQILQEAIDGRLTVEWRQQNPDVEPASELLARIQAEKEQLIKDKKIKKQKPLPPISDAEKPFDLPDGWVWCRLGDTGLINPRNNAKDENIAGFSPMPYVNHKFGIHPRFLTRKWGEIKKGFTHFAENDIIIAKITPCFENSKSGIIQNIPGSIGAGTTELHVVRVNIDDILPEYVYILVKTDSFLINGKKLMKGAVGQKRVPKEYIEKLITPIPPLPEQKAIVTKVEKLLALCDQMETQITASQTHAKQLMQSVLKEAFSHPPG